jgi:UDP-N-acetylmuramate dehydrogenase
MQENVSLRSLNTFGIEARARRLLTLSSHEDLEQTARETDVFRTEHLILGGGSNVLFTRDYPGTVVLNRLPGISVEAEDEDAVWIKAGAGVVWHELVMFAVERGLGGIENMALIPGLCGAAPMQNIGAYGAEIKDVLTRVEAFHPGDLASVSFTNQECRFGYRESIFKREAKGRFVITSITLRLSKRPQLNTSYGTIAAELDAMNIHEPTVADVSQAVIRIRQSKLPDPAVLGNAGSFFKNPVVSPETAAHLRQLIPDLVEYPAAGGVKLAAGQLIEKAGWKGRKVGQCGVHERQALVLVNHGGATGEEIFTLSEAIPRDIREKFGVELEREVNVV